LVVFDCLRQFDRKVAAAIFEEGEDSEFNDDEKGGGMEGEFKIGEGKREEGNDFDWLFDGGGGKSDDGVISDFNDDDDGDVVVVGNNNKLVGLENKKSFL